LCRASPSLGKKDKFLRGLNLLGRVREVCERGKDGRRRPATKSPSVQRAHKVISEKSQENNSLDKSSV
jgi:hypothetical protein